MKKFAIILSGCGQHDGSETHEVILTLLSLAQENAEWKAFAPDVQHHVINHLNEKPQSGEMRAVLEESARLVRGYIEPIEMANLDEFDGIIFPGGLGAVTVLCDWFERKSTFTFHPQVKLLIDAAVAQKKAMGFICIAPMMIPKIYSAAQLTIGNDDSLGEQIAEMGSHHIPCAAQDIVIDHVNKLVSTPANMVAQNIDEVYIGIRKLIKALINMSNK